MGIRMDLLYTNKIWTHLMPIFWSVLIKGMYIGTIYSFNLLTSFDGCGNRNDMIVFSKGTGGTDTFPKGIHSDTSTSFSVKFCGWQTFPTIEELLNNWGATKRPIKKQNVCAKKNTDIKVQTKGLDQLCTLVFNPTLCILMPLKMTLSLVCRGDSHIDNVY